MVATSKVLEELHGIDLIELLEHDQRPTLVLDLKDPLHGDHECSRIVFCNAALRSYPTVFTSIYQRGNEIQEFPEFKEWAFASRTTTILPMAPYLQFLIMASYGTVQY